MSLDDYRARCGELAAAATRHAAERAGAERSYVDGCAALAAIEECALAAVQEADRQIARATTTVVETDLRAQALWDDVAALLRRRPSALPDPALSTVDTNPSVPLARAAEVLVRYRRAPDRRRPPGLFLAALPVLGALTTTPLVLAAHGLPGGVLSGVLVFAAPFAGVLPAREWARRRYRAGLDVGALGLIVLGGMAAGFLLR
jgi:hypothetical protein